MSCHEAMVAGCSHPDARVAVPVLIALVAVAVWNLARRA